MILMEPDQTPYDWHFSLFGIHVRVSPWFWLASALLSWNFAKMGMVYVAISMGCVFVSILLHELGHVWMGRLFGSDGHIVLYSFGGLAVGSSNLSSRWQRIAVFLAGPGIQLLLFAVLLSVTFLGAFSARNEALAVLLSVMLFINLVWPLMNLLPIWPLDGGQVSREIFTWFNPGQGMRWSLTVSLVAAAIIAVNSLIVQTSGRDFIPYLSMISGPWSTLLFGMLAYQSWLMLQQMQPWDQGERWERWDR